jgi:di/tripeptidase
MLAQVQPEPGESSFNLGVIEGGSSINSIAAEASVRIDLRSHDAETLQSLAAAVRRAAAQGLEEENQLAMTGAVEARLQVIGDRPAGRLAPGSELLQAILAVDRALGIESHTGAASTDANLPLSLGLQAIRIGGGGRGGGAHTLEEWFDPTGRELGLRRLLLLTLLMAGVPELQE